MKLSANFTLEELTISETAARRGIDNRPGPLELASLRLVAAKLEEVRSLLCGIKGRDIGIHINSGYRAAAVNAAVGGSDTSAHVYGRAADIIAPGFGPPYDVACAIRDAGIVFDQLIYEHTWVHLGIAATNTRTRQQCLTLSPWREPRYVPGIVLRTDL